MSSVRCDAHFNFHPVGQGCFYSGTINLRNACPDYLEFNSFDFVYDCGSASPGMYLNREISNYSYPHQKIDILVISHFDRDHVCGVPQLLSGRKLRRLVIPYYEPLERLILYAYWNEPGDGDYRRMMEDPIAFFQNDDRFDIGEIVVVGGPKNDGEGSAANIEPTGPNRKRNVFSGDALSELPTEPLPFNDEHAGQRASSELRADVISKEPVGNRTPVLFFQTPYRMTIPIWEFYFYYRRYDHDTERDRKKREHIETFPATCGRNDTDKRKGVKGYVRRNVHR